MSRYQDNKESIYKWREENLDVYREQQRLYQQKHYKKYYDEVRKEKKRIYYLWKKEVSRLNNILLD